MAGGGPASSVLAARLAEDSGRSILLLEAGQDYADPQMRGEAVRDGG